jgi:hypothetical protein
MITTRRGDRSLRAAALRGASVLIDGIQIFKTNKEDSLLAIGDI